MVDLTVSDGEVKLILDTRFYGSAAIIQAGQDFTENFWVLVDGDLTDKMLVTLKPKQGDHDLEKIGLEFSNYVLGLMQNAIN